MRQVIKSAYSYCDLNVDEWVEPGEESVPRCTPLALLISSPQHSSQQHHPELPFTPIPQPISPLPKTPARRQPPPHHPELPFTPIPQPISPLPKTPAIRQPPSPQADQPPQKKRRPEKFTPLAHRREKRTKKLPKKLLD